MIPVPQPKAAPTRGTQRASEPLPPARAHRRPLTLTLAAILLGGLVVVAAVAFAIAVLAFGLNPLLLGLVGVVVLCTVVGWILRLVPQALPGMGIVRSVMGFASFAAIVGIFYLGVYPAIQNGSATSWIPNWGMHAAAPPLSTPATVVYEVTGSAPSASISLSPGSENGGAKAEYSLPFTQAATVQATSSTHYILNASTTDAPDDSTLTCTITVNGAVIATETDSGSSAMALCSGSSSTASR